MTTSQQQRSNKNWNDMPYAALQLIADYHCVKASDALLVVGCICKRWHDAATNYLPANAWRRFYDHLVKVHYQIPGKQIAEAKLPTPDTLETYSNAAQQWYSFTADARALRETFRGVENMLHSWKMRALGTVAEWEGVTIESGRVTDVRLHYESLQGSVDLTKLPAGLRVLELAYNNLSGYIDLTRLPASLQHLGLNANQFSDSIDLTQLPAGLRNLWLDHNTLSGPVDLTKLPTELQNLHLNNNQFSGSVELTRLPASLQSLYLKDNEFSGSVDLTQLPASLLSFYLYANQFSGSVNLTRLPAGLQDLLANSNNFSGSIDLTQLPPELKLLYLQDNKFAAVTSVSNKECEVRVDNAVVREN